MDKSQDILISTPDERPPLLKGHFSGPQGVATQKGFHFTYIIWITTFLNTFVFVYNTYETSHFYTAWLRGSCLSCDGDCAALSELVLCVGAWQMRLGAVYVLVHVLRLDQEHSIVRTHVLSSDSLPGGQKKETVW